MDMLRMSAVISYRKEFQGACARIWWHSAFGNDGMAGSLEIVPHLPLAFFG